MRRSHFKLLNRAPAPLCSGQALGRHGTGGRGRAGPGVGAAWLRPGAGPVRARAPVPGRVLGGVAAGPVVRDSLSDKIRHPEPRRRIDGTAEDVPDLSGMRVG